MHLARWSVALLLPALTAQTPPAPAPVPVEPATAPASAPVATPAVGTKAAAKKAPKPVYDEAADARAEVQKAIAASGRENRRVLIQWGANWCGWCVLLADTMQGDEQLRQKLRNEYDVVKVDVGKFDKNIDLAKELGAEFKSIPFLTVLGPDGKAVVQQNTEPFETKADGKNGHDSKKLLAFLVQHQPKPLDAVAVRDAALAKAKKEGKRVFLHFGAPWCGWCHQLEDWMQQPAPAALLAQDFVDLKIDTDRMQGGQAMLDEARRQAGSKDGGIPWIAFLDADGVQLVTSDGPKGNVGFPYKDEEIAWFVEMLKVARVNLKDDDISALQNMLVAWRTADEAKKGR